MTNILIIEDDFRHVVFLQDVVECKCKFQTIIARSDKEGLKIAKTQKPDLIILDIGLGGMDGFEVCKEIREYPDIADIPLLILTTYPNPEDKIKDFGVGADDYLLKPYDTKELIHRIKALLQRTSKSLCFPQPLDICRLRLICDPGKEIQIRGHGRFILGTKSQNVLNVDPEKYTKKAQNVFNKKDWRFETKEVGEQIYKDIFLDHAKILSAYQKASAKVGKTYKLRLCFESSLNFFRVPVEFLHENNKVSDYFIKEYPITRFINDISPQNMPLSPEFLNELCYNNKELRILLIASNTKPYRPNIDKEVELLEKVLHKSLKAKKMRYNIKYIPTEKATFKLIIKELEECPYHILHYAGHGNYNEKCPDKSYLQFWENENYNGDIEELKISSLNLLLKNSNLRFVYLSCCSGSETSGDTKMLNNDFPGLAYGIVQAGIPSILGFRCEVSDQSAIELALSFYKSLFTQGSLDLALFEARKEIYLNNENDQTWMSPILIVLE